MEDVPGFNLRGRIVGPNGVYCKHIMNETGVRIQIRGRGSGYTEGDGKEADVPMYLHIR